MALTICPRSASKRLYERRISLFIGRRRSELWMGLLRIEPKSGRFVPLESLIISLFCPSSTRNQTNGDFGKAVNLWMGEDRSTSSLHQGIYCSNDWHCLFLCVHGSWFMVWFCWWSRSLWEYLLRRGGDKDIWSVPYVPLLCDFAFWLIRLQFGNLVILQFAAASWWWICLWLELKRRRTRCFWGRDRIKRRCIDSIKAPGNGVFGITQNGKWWNGLICCTMKEPVPISVAVTRYEWRCTKEKCCIFLRNGSMKWVRGYVFPHCHAVKGPVDWFPRLLQGGPLWKNYRRQFVVRYELWCKMEFDAIFEIRH